ncbi:DUF2971 domain-containing protein [Microbulbifer epialgicus]|uniref:DUF2971 domain-containing protein n=1 Tax=Microbulbifer epialgicus TaxID=393907 RepID=A0ABV4NZ81_9GAMM
MDISDQFPGFETARNSLSEKRLYKYRSLANETQKERVKDIVLNHKVRLSKPNDLNDPIEGKPVFQLGDLNDPVYREHFEQWAWNTQRLLPSPPPKNEFISWLRSLSVKQHNSKVEEISIRNQEAIDSKWRVFSLSGTSTSELMWAHYGDSHKGLALVFDASDGEFGVAMKVAYMRARRPIDITSQDEKEILFSTILAKREAWSYEEEFRCVAAEPWQPPLPHLNNQFLSFKPKQLIGVIFGAKIEAEDRQEVLAWSKQRAAPLSFSQAEITLSGDIKCVPIQL